uniref:Uncharacterized protein n=1 Tax=Lotus japonicus TaxID=34305 RepID=I3T1Z1_LOTJA|nr:unknown [Lotus japonicus]
MKKRKKGSLWCQRYFIRHSQGSVIGLRKVQQQQQQQMVKEVETLTTVEVVVALLRKWLLKEMRCLLLLLGLLQ